MKITIWIREDDDGVVKVRTDHKFESRDTPFICRRGLNLINALEGNEVNNGK